jgi:hypothetical protein
MIGEVIPYVNNDASPTTNHTILTKKVVAREVKKGVRIPGCTKRFSDTNDIRIVNNTDAVQLVNFVA